MLKKPLKYFKPREFTMHHGSVNVFLDMDSQFLLELDDFRDDFGHPIYLTSSYRSESYNLSIGGVKNSMHLKGRAIDCDSTRYTAEQKVKFVKKAIARGFTVGVSKNFFHLDNRKNQTIFGY